MAHIFVIVAQTENDASTAAESHYGGVGDMTSHKHTHHQLGTWNCKSIARMKWKYAHKGSEFYCPMGKWNKNV